MKALGFAVLAALAVTAAQGGEPQRETTWYSIVTENGAPIGHAYEEILPNAGGREVVDSQEILVGGEQVTAITLMMDPEAHNTILSWRTVRKEDKAGHTLSIQSSSLIGGVPSETAVRVLDGKAEVTHKTGAGTRTTLVPLTADVRFDGGDGLLAAWDPAKTPRLEFDDFDEDTPAVEHVVLEAVAGAPPDAQGRIAVLRKRFDGTQLLAVARLLIDRAHRISEVTQPMIGTNITIRMTDRATALAPHSPYRVLPAMMTKSLFRIPDSVLRKHIRFRFAFRDGITFDLPQTGEQRVTAEPGFVTLDICDDCGPGLATDAATLADARRPTAWLQSNAPQIRAIAEPIARLPLTDTQKMDILRRKARPYIRKIDFNGHYSALETMQRRAGDCTEAAVLLAAFGRAAGIPTRVVNGLVYSRESYHGVSNAFLPHSWTLAFVDGKWKSFDLALDTFDSTHIAFTVGDGDKRSIVTAAQLGGLLHWESMAEVRSQPSP